MKISETYKTLRNVCYDEAESGMKDMIPVTEGTCHVRVIKEDVMFSLYLAGITLSSPGLSFTTKNIRKGRGKVGNCLIPRGFV